MHILWPISRMLNAHQRLSPCMPNSKGVSVEIPNFEELYSSGHETHLTDTNDDCPPSCVPTSPFSCFPYLLKRMLWIPLSIYMKNCSMFQLLATSIRLKNNQTQAIFGIARLFALLAASWSGWERWRTWPQFAYYFMLQCSLNSLHYCARNMIIWWF